MIKTVCGNRRKFDEIAKALRQQQMTIQPRGKFNNENSVLVNDEDSGDGKVIFFGIIDDYDDDESDLTSCIVLIEQNNVNLQPSDDDDENKYYMSEEEESRRPEPLPAARSSAAAAQSLSSRPNLASGDGSNSHNMTKSARCGGPEAPCRRKEPAQKAGD
eukprot:2315639-Heterocapsa_arctica.AAC.1